MAARLPVSVVAAALLTAGGLLSGLLSGCGERPAPAAPADAARAPLYFDVKGVVNAQIEQLTARRAVVTKQVSLRGGAPETTAVPQVKWADELQLFLQADINKAALRGAYAVDSAREADGSTRHRYRRRPGHDNAPVEQLWVRQRQGQPLEIRARISQQNTLFAARKQLRMRFEQGRLTADGVTGAQKLVLFDTLRYATAATVR